MTSASAAPVRPRPPRVVRYAVIAIATQIVLTLTASFLRWGFTSDLSRSLIKSNSKLAASNKNKRPDDTYLIGSTQLTKDLHDYRVGVTLNAIILCVLFALAAVAIWRGMGLSRWLYMLGSVLFSVGGIVALSADGPAVTNLSSFLAAVASIAAIVLLVMPQSALFFSTAKAARMPPPLRAAAADAPRPTGLRGFFAPPPPRQPRESRPAATKPSRRRSPAQTRPATRAAGAMAVSETGSNDRGKPKVRSNLVDTEVVSSPPGAAAPSTPAPGTPARGRGKSRRVAS